MMHPYTIGFWGILHFQTKSMVKSMYWRCILLDIWLLVAEFPTEKHTWVCLNFLYPKSHRLTPNCPFFQVPFWGIHHFQTNRWL
jgi:hypothetical protein